MKFYSELSSSVFNSKYLLENETDPNQSKNRIVREFARVFPEMKDEAEEYIDKFWYVPAGGIWRASGNPDNNVSHINCTTLKPVEDTLESIFDSLYKWAKYAAFGQGEGIDISQLRPKGAKVHNSSRNSTGAVSFMNLYDAVLKVIAQQGRRGASLISIKDTHPDLLEFIKIKDKPESDKSRIDTANISIQTSDAFMEAVIADEEWTLRFENKYEVIENKVRAKDIFEEICKMAWKRGDPGLQFIDKAIRESNSNSFNFNITGTNACCFTGNTLITTKKGLFPIKKLVGKEVEIYDGENWVKNNSFKSYGIDQLYRVHLNSGSYFDVTKNHRFYLNNGDVKQTYQLVYGDILESSPEELSEGFINEKGAYLKGFMLGDGTVDKGEDIPRPLLYLYEPKYMCKIRLEDSLKEISVENNLKTNTSEKVGWISSPSNQNRITIIGLTARDRDNLYKWGEEYKKKLPEDVFNWNNSNKYNFIAGLFDSNGTAFDNPKRFGYQLSSINKEFLVDILRLLNSIGVYGKVALNKKVGDEIIKEQTFFCHDIWRLTIPQEYAIRLSKKVKFERLPSFSERTSLFFNNFRYNKVIAVEALKREEEVFCTTVPSTSKFLINSGIITGNSEQWLDPENVCNLGHINLAKFNEYGWDIFPKLIRFGIYFGISVIINELKDNRSPTKLQREKLIQMPRVGLGITGLADYFIDNKIVYGSEESILEARKIFQTLVKYSYKTNGEIGKKLGSFPSYTKDKMLKSDFIKRIYNEGLITDEDLEYQYCVACNTIAPVGSGSLIANVGGSGIEPIFSKYYVRRERSTTSDWKEWFTFNPYIEKYLKEHNLDVTKENCDSLIDDYWVMSYNVDNMNKIKLVSEIQKWIDSSISVTFNIPEESTIEDVKNIYIEAWKNQLKGITVYREGSLTGILITEKNYEKSKKESESKSKDKFKGDNYIKRPNELPCDIYEAKYKENKFIVLIGLKDNEPYEVFVTPNNDNTIDVEKFKTGTIKKVKSNHYDLIVQNGVTKTAINNIGKTFDSLYGTVSRMVSMSLRHGVALPFIIDQLNKDSGFVAFEKVLSRILKKYIKDNTVTKKVCPECGAILVYANGCISCPSCGYSKCE